MKIITLAVIFLLLLVPSGKSLSSDKDDFTHGETMAIALSEKIMATFLCQNYIGGLNQYRFSKFDATEIYSHVTGDKNKAVIKIDEIEQKIKQLRPDQRIEETFEKSKIPESDRINFCQNLISEATDKVQLAKARLGLL